MIDLNGKIIPDGALLKELEQFGFCYVDGVPTSNDDAACQVLIDGFSLDHFKAHRKGEATALAMELRNRATAGVSPAEMCAWPIKRDEAAAFAAGGGEAAAPMLAAEAAAAGITLAELIARVAANVSHFAALEAGIGGRRRAHISAIDALTTWAEVDAYDLTTGWPAV